MKRGRPFERGTSGNPRGRPSRSFEEREIAAQERKIVTDIKAAAKELTQDALDTLKAAMSAPGAPWAARVAAAGHLLDRGWGKPVQPVDANVNFFDTLSDMEQRALLAALIALQAEEEDKPALTN